MTPKPVLLLAVSALALAGCQPTAKNDAETAPVTIEAQLDPCQDKTGVAQLICKDETLGPAAQEVRGALVEAANSVSEEGGKLIVDAQRRWLETQRVICGVDAGKPDAEACLKTALDERAKEARTAVEQVGGFTFQTVEISSATAVTAEAAAASGLGEEAPGAIATDIRFPRIDNPKNDPIIARFNEAVRQTPRFSLADQTEEVVNYRIAFAGPELVSVRFDLYDMTLGAASPNTGMKAVTINMKTGAPLAATDVFTAGTGWEKDLQKRVMAGIAKQLVERGAIRRTREAAGIVPAAELGDAVTKPHLWTVTEGALVVLIPEGTIGPGALGDFEVAVPWTDLKAYLNPAAPSPIRPAA
jgi:hypothetical protein